MFYSRAVHPTSAGCVCKSASNFVLSTNLKNFPEKLVSGAVKSCEGLCDPRRLANLKNSTTGTAVRFHTNTDE